MKESPLTTPTPNTQATPRAAYPDQAAPPSRPVREMLELWCDLYDDRAIDNADALDARLAAAEAEVTRVCRERDEALAKLTAAELLARQHAIISNNACHALEARSDRLAAAEARVRELEDGELAVMRARNTILAAEVEVLTKDGCDLRDVLLRYGFVRCDAPACNCGSWHPRFGLYERWEEIKSDIADAGIDLNGRTLRAAVRELIHSVAALHEQVAKFEAEPVVGYSAYKTSTEPAWNSPITEVIGGLHSADICLGNLVRKAAHLWGAHYRIVELRARPVREEVAGE
jgi:hypothetical protein